MHVTLSPTPGLSGWEGRSQVDKVEDAIPSLAIVVRVDGAEVW